MASLSMNQPKEIVGDYFWENNYEKHLKIIDKNKVVSMDDDQSATIILNQPITSLNSNYFEVKIIDYGTYYGEEHWSHMFSIGLARKDISLDDWPGHEIGESEKEAIAYYTDEHQVWYESKKCEVVDSDYVAKANVIGCGLERDVFCFFTIDGKKMKTSYKIDKNVMNPILTLQDKGLVLEINLGENDFVYKERNIPQTNNMYGPSFSTQWASHIKMIKSDENYNIFEHLNDTTIISKDGKRIGCHRLILSVRSEVFRAMFEHEKIAGKEIYMADFDGETIRLMLDFIYGDLENKTEESVDFDLLAIANKYALKGLQSYCEDVLSQKLDSDNVLDAWKSSKFLGSRILVEKSEYFIKQNWGKIKSTKAYSVLMKDDIQSMVNLLVSVIGSHEDDMVQDLLNSLKNVKKIE